MRGICRQRTAMLHPPALCTTPVPHLSVWALGLSLSVSAWAADPAAAPATQGGDVASKKSAVEALPTASSNPMAEKIRAAMAGTVVASKKMTVTVDSKDAPVTSAAPTRSAAPAAKVLASRRYSQDRAAAVAGHTARNSAAIAGQNLGDMQWSYEGEAGPQSWGKLKPDFTVCATGKRQSPINIEDGNTLQGPAEPVQFAYATSNATVVNSGHTIQVDVQGENSITVRGSSYRLLHVDFHTPSEIQINFKRLPMAAHLVHKNSEGQIAVIAVLLDEGASNPVIDKIWTYMPLDKGDRVRMPAGLLNLTDLLPSDQRYYQFIGSQTTPPCTEGVLWMVLKQPVTVSKAQYKLFTQLYPNNARPVQPLNGRPVREAQ